MTPAVAILLLGLVLILAGHLALGLLLCLVVIVLSLIQGVASR